jgi:hypothetical protein
VPVSSEGQTYITTSVCLMCVSSISSNYERCRISQLETCSLLVVLFCTQTCGISLLSTQTCNPSTQLNASACYLCTCNGVLGSFFLANGQPLWMCLQTKVTSFCWHSNTTTAPTKTSLKYGRCVANSVRMSLLILWFRDTGGSYSTEHDITVQPFWPIKLVH